MLLEKQSDKTHRKRRSLLKDKSLIKRTYSIAQGTTLNILYKEIESEKKKKKKYIYIYIGM